MITLFDLKENALLTTVDSVEFSIKVYIDETKSRNIYQLYVRYFYEHQKHKNILILLKKLKNNNWLCFYQGKICVYYDMHEDMDFLCLLLKN